MKHVLLITIASIALLISTIPGLAQKPSTTQQEAQITRLPGLVIDQTHHHVDVQARVVLRDGNWLELLMCTPGTREHESILTTPARPSHIHLALIMLGLKPGHPMTGKKVDDKMVITQATGPWVAVNLIYNLKGKQHTVGANQWIYNKTDNKTLADNRWMFTGSSFIQAHDQNIYRADANGTVISLVNFGDDLLARKTNITSRNDNAQWQAQTKLIPPVGTTVTVRLTPVPAAAKGKKETADPVNP